jgi:hypothetical protein
VLTQNTSVTFGGASNFALSFGDNVGPGPSASLRLDNTAGISAAQTANAQFGGSVSAPIRVVTANYTLAADDYHGACCNNAANVAPVTITPPAAAASNKGRVYIVKRGQSGPRSEPTRIARWRTSMEQRGTSYSVRRAR